ncbi:hypothetical protein [Ferrovibrio terrae]|uniref:hypothetical protein n=1 Tax=Ferrovibrio terrae TaxID=2594003 RepID=UPI003137F24D
MALNTKNFAALSYANGYTHWHYATPDTAATVDTTGYFNLVASMVNVGDRITANVGIGGTPAYGEFVVLSNTGGVVDVGDMTAMGGTDTD